MDSNSKRLGTYDDYMQILGRGSDVTNIGREKVNPTENKNLIDELDNTQVVVAYGELNALLGQVIASDVVFNENEELVVLRKRIREACSKCHGKSKAPSKIRIINQVAVSNGKKARNRI